MSVRKCQRVLDSVGVSLRRSVGVASPAPSQLSPICSEGVEGIKNGLESVGRV